MVPGAEALGGAARQEKPVWQLGFYAPLEQTKGLKLFCDAVELLPPTVLHRPGFEVWFVGEEARVDQSLSGAWLRARTADWTWKTHVLASPTRRAPSQTWLCNFLMTASPQQSPHALHTPGHSSLVLLFNRNPKPLVQHVSPVN